MVHSIVNGNTLDRTYEVLSNVFGKKQDVDIEMFERVAKQLETVILLESDKAISLWARLLPTYRDHSSKPSKDVSTSIGLSVDTVKGLLGCSEASQGVFKNTLSKVKVQVSNSLPKGTILTSTTSNGVITFSFLRASSKESAHTQLVALGVNGLPTIDRLVALLEVV